jgi:hypothetical protein
MGDSEHHGPDEEPDDAERDEPPITPAKMRRIGRSAP